MKIFCKFFASFGSKQHSQRILLRIPISIAQLVFTFINIRGTLEYLGPNNYGQFATILGTSSLIAPILGFGMTFSILNYSAELQAPYFRQKIAKYLTVLALLLLLICGIVYFLYLNAIISIEFELVMFLGCLLCLNSIIWSVVGSHGWWLLSQFQFLISAITYSFYLFKTDLITDLASALKFLLIGYGVSLVFGLFFLTLIFFQYRNIRVNPVSVTAQANANVFYPFLLSIIYSLGTQLDIVIVANLLDFKSAALYQISLQLFQPLVSILFAVAFPVRSKYRLLSNVEKVAQYKFNQKYFFYMGLVLFAINIPLAYLAFPLLSLGKLTVPPLIFLFFAVNGILSIVSYASSLIFSDSKDVFWIFRCEAQILLFINLPASIVCTVVFGFVGPILGTVVANIIRIIVFNRKGLRRIDVS